MKDYTKSFSKYYEFLSTKNYELDASLLIRWMGSCDTVKVMDFGSGCGIHLSHLKDKINELNYLGVEPSKHMRRESIKRGITNLSSDFHDKDFTHVYSLYNVLNCIHYSDMKNIINKILDSMVFDGEFLFEIWNEEQTNVYEIETQSREFDCNGLKGFNLCSVPEPVNDKELYLYYFIKNGNHEICQSKHHIYIHHKSIFEDICFKRKISIRWFDELEGVLGEKFKKKSLSLFGLISL